jgi:hypothetical protein
MPYGVDDVLKLTRAQVSEDITVNFVGNSGVAYNLAPDDIVYLKGQGVSDRVINAMMDERKRVVAQASMAVAAQTAAQAPMTDPNAPLYAPSYTADSQGETQAAPSTVYVIPQQQPYAYYPYPTYYGSYYSGYYGPTLAIGFAFGGHSHGCWSGYHGSYHGGHHH